MQFVAAILVFLGIIGLIFLITCIPATVLWLVWTKLGMGALFFEGMLDDKFLNITFWQFYGICLVLSVIGSFFKGSYNVSK